MPTISFNIPADKIQDVIDAMKWYTEKPTDFQGTDGDWAKEVIRKFVVHTVQRYKTVQAQKNVQVTEDNNLVT